MLLLPTALVAFSHTVHTHADCRPCVCECGGGGGGGSGGGGGRRGVGDAQCSHTEPVAVRSQSCMLEPQVGQINLTRH